MNPIRPTRTRGAVVALGLVLSVLVPAAALRAEGDKPPSVVRLGSVNTPVQSGLLAALLPGFEQVSGYRVEVYGGNDVYQRAERGEVDLLISHYGKAPVEQFVLSGQGAWPRPVFSNQYVLVGPRDDPAGIRGMTDPFAAVRQIAARGAPFVVSADPGTRYLAELLLAGAGEPKRDRWYSETTESRGRAMQLAEQKGAYTLWGSFPFERFRSRHDTGLQVMVWDTPVFHRVMATLRVNPGKFPGINAEGAKALEAWLLSPAVQAAVAAYREPGLERQTWWPAARDNNPAQLLGLEGGSEED